MIYTEEGHLYRKDGSVVKGTLEFDYSATVTQWNGGKTITIAPLTVDQTITFGMNAVYVRLKSSAKIKVKVNSGTDQVTCSSDLMLTGDSTDYFTQIVVSNEDDADSVTLEYWVAA